MEIPLFPLALAGYALCLVFAGLAVFRGSARARLGASWLLGLTWLLHFAVVVRRAFSSGSIPLTNLSGYLLVLGWIVQTLHLYVWFRLRVWAAGVLLPLIAGLTLLGAYQLPATGGLTYRSGFFLFHVTVSTLGMATLCVAFAMSLIYLIQENALKSKKALRSLERMPALEVCDRVGFHALTVGFLLLTFGIATGVVVNTALHERLTEFDPKQTLSLLAWLVFAGILGSRSVLGYRGRKSAYMTIAGFALGLLTVLGIAL